MKHFLLRLSLVTVAAGSLAACGAEPFTFSGVHPGQARADGPLPSGATAFSGPLPGADSPAPRPPPD